MKCPYLRQFALRLLARLSLVKLEDVREVLLDEDRLQVLLAALVDRQKVQQALIEAALAQDRHQLGGALLLLERDKHLDEELEREPVLGQVLVVQHEQHMGRNGRVRWKKADG